MAPIAFFATQRHFLIISHSISFVYIHYSTFGSGKLKKKFPWAKRKKEVKEVKDVCSTLWKLLDGYDKTIVFNFLNFFNFFNFFNFLELSTSENWIHYTLFYVHATKYIKYRRKLSGKNTKIMSNDQIFWACLSSSGRWFHGQFG